MKKNLVITGLGAVTPLGNNVESYWHNLITGKCGVGQISRFDTSRLPVHIAAEVRDFDISVHLPASVARSSSLFMAYAYAAAQEALEHSALDLASKSHKVGICMGTAMAGVEDVAKSGADYELNHSGRISPHLVPRVIANMATAHLAIQLGIKGPGMTLSTACSAGSDAVICAAQMLLAGDAEAVIVMGGESILSPPIVSSLAQARALSRRNEIPAEASRPFDLERDGFVIGEGGGAIVLETEDHARRRGATILASLCGWGNSLDAFHITAPDPEGNGAAACMKTALHKADLNPEDIGYINAHGTSTQLGDKAETEAVKKVFGSRHAPPISSTKGATGHLMGAGGLTELIACVKSIQESILPPTLNLDNPDPQCDLDYIPHTARKAEIQYAMSNSLGFGGQNSSLIIGRYEMMGK